jgi:hypothetical protein
VLLHATGVLSYYRRCTRAKGLERTEKKKKNETGRKIIIKNDSRTHDVAGPSARLRRVNAPRESDFVPDIGHGWVVL